MQAPGRIWTPDPIIKQDLTTGLASWLLGLPELSGGTNYFDLLERSRGVLTNGPTWTVEPNSFAALLLDGTNDYCTWSVDPVLNRSEGTLAIAVKASSNSGFREIVNLRVDGNNEVEITDFNGNFGINLRFKYGAGGTSTTVNTSSLSTSAWTFLTMTWSKAADQFRAFVNGVQVGSTQTGLGTFSSSALAWAAIGSTNGGGDYFAGCIGTAILFNRAFQIADVYSLYAQWLEGFPDWLRTRKYNLVLNPPPSVFFRKTLSGIGGRVGARQAQGS